MQKRGARVQVLDLAKTLARPKRSISNIVATVLIILITVAAVAIIWMVIAPMLKGKLSSTTTTGQNDLIIENSQGYTVYDPSSGKICVQVKRGNDNDNITGVQFVFGFDGSSTTVDNDTVPPRNGAKTYCFSMATKPNSISIAPIFSINGKKVVGEITSKITDIQTGDLANVPVIGTINPGNNAVCNPNWSCGDWSACVGGSQNQTCTDLTPTTSSCHQSSKIVSRGCCPTLKSCDTNYPGNCGTLLDNGCGGTLDCSSSVYCQLLVSVVSYWKFENNLNDEKGLNNLVPITNAIYTIGRMGRGLALDNSEGSGAFKNNPSGYLLGQNFTVAFWVEPKGESSWPNFFRLDDSRGYTNVIIFAPYNKIYLQRRTGPTSTLEEGIAMTSNLTNNQWVHVAYVIDNDTYVYSYVNGNLVGSKTLDTRGHFLPPTSLSKLSIGGMLIDEVMMFSKVLNQSQIQAIYNTQKNEPDSCGICSNGQWCDSTSHTCYTPYFKDSDQDGWSDGTNSMVRLANYNTSSELNGHIYGDCNDNDASVHPGATEICNNGIDDNCNGLTDCADSTCSGNPTCPSCHGSFNCSDYNNDPSKCFDLGCTLNQICGQPGQTFDCSVFDNNQGECPTPVCNWNDGSSLCEGGNQNCSDISAGSRCDDAGCTDTHNECTGTGTSCSIFNIQGQCESNIPPCDSWGL